MSKLKIPCVLHRFTGMCLETTPIFHLFCLLNQWRGGLSSSQKFWNSTITNSNWIRNRVCRENSQDCEPKFDNNEKTWHTVNIQLCCSTDLAALCGNVSLLQMNLVTFLRLIMFNCYSMAFHKIKMLKLHSERHYYHRFQLSTECLSFLSLYLETKLIHQIAL